MTKKAVVLVHGLFMKKQIMSYLKFSYEKNGFIVYNFDYNTVKYNDETLSSFNNFVLNIKEKDVYFVGHSMGGILIRNYFEKYNPIFNDTCIVTIGTPHNGSSLGKKVKETYFDFILGTAGDSGVFDGLPEWSEKCDLGCIIGIWNLGPNNIYNAKRKEGDGTVLVTEAYLKNAKDTIKIKSNHTGLVYSKKVIKHSIKFFKERSFI